MCDLRRPDEFRGTASVGTITVSGGAWVFEVCRDKSDDRLDLADLASEPPMESSTTSAADLNCMFYVKFDYFKFSIEFYLTTKWIVSRSLL